MKLYRNAIVLVLMLAILGGVYYFISQKKPEIQNEQDTALVILETEKEKISEVSIDNEKGKLFFTKKGENWTIQSADTIKLVQSKVDSLIRDAANITAEQIVEEKAQDLEKYGLKSPKATVGIKLTDGTDKTVFIGDMVPSKTGYYVKNKDSETVYTIYSGKGDAFLNGLEQYRDTTLFTLKPEEVTYIAIEGSTRERIIIKTKGDKPEDQTGVLSTWDIIEPIKKDGDNQHIGEDILAKLPEITVKDFVDDNPADLSKYGLDAPSYTFEVKDKNNKSIKLLLGNKKDDSFYLKVDGSTPVYTVEASKVEFKDIPAFNLMEKFAYLVNIDKVDKFEVNYQGKKSTFEITREGEEATYKADGKEASEDAFKKFYQEVIGLIVDGMNEQQVGGVPVASYTFYHNNGAPNVTVEFVDMDDRNYAVFKDGKSEFYIKKKKVQQMLDALEIFLKDPAKKED